MKRITWVGASACVLFASLSGCTATTLTAAGRGVSVEKADAKKECSEVGIISASSSNFVGETDANARNKLRNEAAERGANYVRLDTYAENGNGVRYTGTAYKCP